MLFILVIVHQHSMHFRLNPWLHRLFTRLSFIIYGWLWLILFIDLIGSKVVVNWTIRNSAPFRYAISLSRRSDLCMLLLYKVGFAASDFLCSVTISLKKVNWDSVWTQCSWALFIELDSVTIISYLVLWGCFSHQFIHYLLIRKWSQNVSLPNFSSFGWLSLPLLVHGHFWSLFYGVMSFWSPRLGTSSKDIETLVDSWSVLL